MNYSHQQSAHCESGVASSLLKFHGLDVSEPMAFGLASGLTFAYLPFIKINGLPLVAYRLPPRAILRMLSWRIKGLKIKFKNFRSISAGEKFLNNKIEQSKLVGLQTSVFYLPYFPKEMRFHFNAHNLLVFGKQDNNYLISDPVFSAPVSCDASSLNKARFAKGALAPKGMMYWIEKEPSSIDFVSLIPKAIRFTGKMNGSFNFVPIAGVKGMKNLANTILKLDKKSDRYKQLFLGHLVRMQEEIGTGGAGFRYMYAAFLQESAEILANQELEVLAKEFIEVGDQWREFALLCARINKNRGEQTLQKVANLLLKIADTERVLYDQMAKFKLKNN